MSQTVLTNVDDSVATITLNRPEVLNVLNPDMGQDLRKAVEHVESNDAIRCVVLTGAGDHFMAGGDIGFFRASLEQFGKGDKDLLEPLFDDIHDIIRIVNRMAKPAIASVRGAVAGFGVSLMAACDLAIAAEDSVFTLAYCHLGTSPDGGSTYVLPRIVGTKRAMELALLGERFDAQRALALGVINKAVPSAELEAETGALAARLAAGPARAYAHTKALINRSLDTPLEAQLDAEQACFTECAATNDFAEGVNAFIDKRKPSFG